MLRPVSRSLACVRARRELGEPPDHPPTRPHHDHGIEGGGWVPWCTDSPSRGRAESLMNRRVVTSGHTLSDHGRFEPGLVTDSLRL